MQRSIGERTHGKQLRLRPKQRDLVSGSVPVEPGQPVVANVAAAGSSVPVSVVVVAFAVHSVHSVPVAEDIVELVAVASARSTYRWTKCNTALTRHTSKKGSRYRRRPNAADRRLHCRNKRRKIFGIEFDQLLVLGSGNKGGTSNISSGCQHSNRIGG